eukprot:Pompholyxophrys_punicea_v1_NODE_182_length_2964_cov_38.441389.p1 type:complete len:509 gc:universal NODE_182_length_2964_cov_38.441389:960-2486(+)
MDHETFWDEDDNFFLNRDLELDHSNNRQSETWATKKVDQILIDKVENLNHQEFREDDENNEIVNSDEENEEEPEKIYENEPKYFGESEPEKFDENEQENFGENEIEKENRLFEEDFLAENYIQDFEEEVEHFNAIDNLKSKASMSLYYGCEISVFEHAVDILKFSIENKLTNEALDELLEVLARHFPRDQYAGFRKAKDLYKFFSCTQKDLQIRKFCATCGIERPNSCGCSSEEDLLFEIPLKTVVQEFFSEKDFIQQLSHPTARNDIQDVFDGENFKRLKAAGFFDLNENLALGINTDGVSPFNSSKSQFWPILLNVHSLPVKKRFKSTNIKLVGLWCGKKKPNMDVFLDKIIRELCLYYTDGFKIWDSNSNSYVVSRGVILTASFDAPAKAEVLKMVYFNGQYGCPMCENPGEVVECGKGHARIYQPFVASERSVSRMVVSGKKCEEKNRAYGQVHCHRGLLGVSKLFLLPYFSLSMIILDYLHVVCLGVVKYFMNLWFSPSYRKV